MPKDVSGKKNPRWKGGKYFNKRFNCWFIWKPDHPFAGDGKGKYVRQSRLIAEKYFKRYLLPQEEVHHINEDRSDDRPENLYVFPSKKEHTIYHNLKNKDKLVSNLLKPFQKK